MQLPEPGALAPDFDLPSDGPKPIRLSAFQGENVALFFYPKDDTTACTAEAIDFNRLRAKFKAAGTRLVGVSPDSPRSHEKFKAKHSLKIALASDEARTACEAYGVWREKSLYGRKYMGVLRTTWLIDREGRVAARWDNVKVAGHADAVLAAAKALNEGVLAIP